MPFFLKKILHILHSITYICDTYRAKIAFSEINKRAVIGNNFNKVEHSKKSDTLSCKIYNNNSKESIIISDNVCFFGEIFCNKYGKINIGQNTVVGRNTTINIDNSISIGKYCMIARDVLIQDNNSHPLSDIFRRAQLINYSKIPIDTYESENGPIVIGDDVWIGTRAIILKNVTIGHGSIVAAGAVVTKNVPPMSIVAGNPAKVVKEISRSEDTPISPNY